MSINAVRWVPNCNIGESYLGSYQTSMMKHCVKSVQIRSFFCSVFSCIWTEYGDLRTKYPISVEIEENADLKKLRFWSFFMQWCNALIVKCQVIITLTNVGCCWNCHYFWIYYPFEKPLLSASQMKNNNNALKGNKKMLTADRGN